MAMFRLLCDEKEEHERERRREEVRAFEDAARTWAEQIRMLLFGELFSFNGIDSTLEDGRIPEPIRLAAALPAYDREIKFAVWADHAHLLEMVIWPGDLVSVRLPRARFPSDPHRAAATLDRLRSPRCAHASGQTGSAARGSMGG